MPIWLIFAAIAVISIALLATVLVVYRARASRRDLTSGLSSQSELEYQARNDLIPDLEETIKVYSFFQTGETGPQAAPPPQPVAIPAAAGRHRGPRRTFRRDRLAEAS